MSESEIIRLDAEVLSVVAKSVFRARLPNGHEIVVYATGDDKVTAAQIGIGETVAVEMSPYDMSTGRLVLRSRGV